MNIYGHIIILELLNPNQPEKKEREEKIENLEIINSYDMEEVFGSELNSKKSHIAPQSPSPEENSEKNFFNQPMRDLMKSFPLSSIITFPTLNRVQEECFDLLYRTDERALITSPTGSGKTKCIEIFIYIK